MKSRVEFSIYVHLLTGIVCAGLIVGILVYISKQEPIGAYILFSVFCILIMLGLFFAPFSISTDKSYVTINSILRKRKIRIEDISEIELFQPTMGAIRICASGGFIGYWGIFREGDVGNYMAFYGKSSDCFMIRLKNGDKYVLGCKNPMGIVSDIKNKMNLL